MMKHGVLARFISILLAVLALICIAAGIFGLRKNAKDAAENLRTLTLLKERKETYLEYSALLKDKPGYAELKEELDEKQSEYDKAQSQHKTDLAEYSATKGGIISGKEQLQEAYKTLVAGEALLDEKIAAAYEAAEKAAVETVNGKSEIKPLLDAIAQKDTVQNGVDSLNAGIAQAEAAQESLPDTISYLESQIDAKKSEITTKQGEIASEEDEETKKSLETDLASLKAELGTYEAQKTQSEEALQSLPAQIEALKSQLTEAQAGLDQINQAEASYNAIISAAKTQARAAVDSNSELNAAKEKIRIGYESISLGNWEIDKMQASLPDKEEELDSEIDPLEKEAKELETQWAEADEIKENEKKLSSVKALLMSNDNIKDAVANGEDLIEAAETEISNKAADDKKDYNLRLIANMLAIAGGVFGILGIPAAFEKLKSRFFLIAPVVLFTLCTACADALSVFLGRGQMYSCLIAAVFGIIQFAVILPKKKIS